MADLLNKTVKTPAGDAPVIPVLIVSLGAYLTWFGIHYWRSDTRWPTDPLKAVLTGNTIPTPDRSADEAAIKGIVTSAQAAGSGSASAAGGAAAGSSGGTAPTGTLTKDQIKSLWTSNGGSPGTAAIAAAIAEAESSGRTGVTSVNPDGGTNVGLWQLDTKGVGAGYTITQLQDPATNARITVLHTANGSNWGEWETWHTGAYKQFL